MRMSDWSSDVCSSDLSLFLDQGFDLSDLAAGVGQSGGSLATLYELFGNKQGLLRAVIERGEQERRATLDRMIPQMELPAEILRLVARYLHDHLMTPRAISLTRIIIAESLRDPHFGRGFCEDHVKHMNDLAEIFQEWSDSGKAQIDDPLAAAKLFNAMIFSDAQLNALIGFEPERRLAAQEQMEWRLSLFIEIGRAHV